MPHIFCFIEINSNNSTEILNNKITQLGLNWPGINWSLQDINLPLTSAKAIFQKTQISMRKAKYLSYRVNVLNELFSYVLPLLSQEKEVPVPENLFLLQNNFCNFNQGTPVIKRTTNYANYYFLVPSVEFDAVKMSVFLKEELRFVKNGVLKWVNINANVDPLLYIILNLNLISCELIPGYGFNQLVALRYALIPEFIDFAWMQDKQNASLPALDTIIDEKYPLIKNLWVQFKKLVKITLITAESVSYVLTIESLIKNEIERLLKTDIQNPSSLLLEKTFAFSLHLSLLKDLSIFFKANHTLSYSKLTQRFDKLTRIYNYELIKFLKYIRIDGNNQKPLHENFVSYLANLWDKLSANNFTDFDCQFANFIINNDCKDKYFTNEIDFLNQIAAIKSAST